MSIEKEGYSSAENGLNNEYVALSDHIVEFMNVFCKDVADGSLDVSEPGEITHLFDHV